MIAATLFGVALTAAGWLLAWSVALRDVERLHSSLAMGLAPRAGRGERRSTLGRWLTDRSVRRGWPGSPWSYWASLLASAVAGLVVGWRLAGPVGASLALVGGPLAIEAFLSRRLAADSGRLEGQLGDAVAALGAAVRAGLSVRRAVEEAARGSDPPMRDHLRSVIHRMEMGEPPEAALAGLAEHVAQPDLRLVINALRVHRRTGGNLPALLDEIGAVMSQRSLARREVRGLTAQGRASGAVLAVLPVAFVALLSGTGGDGLGAFYRTPLGSALLVVGLMLAGAGHVWIRRILAKAEADR